MSILFLILSFLVGFVGFLIGGDVIQGAILLALFSVVFSILGVHNEIEMRNIKDAAME
jgi:hypothetical protein